MHQGSVSTSQKPVHTSAEQQQPLSALSKISTIALFGNGLTYIVEAVVALIFVGLTPIALVPVLIFALLAWGVAVLILRHVRWAPLAGAIVGIVTPSLYLAVPATRTGLLHPSNSPFHFALLIVTFAFALVAIVTGITEVAQRPHESVQPTPRWLRFFLGGVTGLVVGMIAIASLVGAIPQSSTINTATNGVPTVHTLGANFLTNVVLVSKSQYLVITDDDGEEHYIQNGMWTASGTPKPQVEAGAPTVNNVDLKSGSITIGPFNMAGVFHLYCPIHQGMNLTVVVQ